MIRVLDKFIADKIFLNEPAEKISCRRARVSVDLLVLFIRERPPGRASRKAQVLLRRVVPGPLCLIPCKLRQQLRGPYWLCLLTVLPESGEADEQRCQRDRQDHSEPARFRNVQGEPHDPQREDHHRELEKEAVNDRGFSVFCHIDEALYRNAEQDHGADGDCRDYHDRHIRIGIAPVRDKSRDPKGEKGRFSERAYG